MLNSRNESPRRTHLHKRRDSWIGGKEKDLACGERGLERVPHQGAAFVAT